MSGVWAGMTTIAPGDVTIIHVGNRKLVLRLVTEKVPVLTMSFAIACITICVTYPVIVRSIICLVPRVGEHMG